MPVAAIFVLLSFLGFSALNLSIVMLILALAGSIVCIKFAPYVIELTGKNDPGEVVADEFAGQAVTFLGLGAFAAIDSLIIAAAGFLLFRFFDILKPWPVRNLEKLDKGWGILADDIGAGIYAATILQIIVRLWIAP